MVENKVEENQDGSSENKTGAALSHQHQDLLAVSEFFQKNGLILLLAGSIIIAIAVIFTIRRSQTETNLLQASQILSSARSSKDLETVVEKHSSTPYAPIALMKLAKSHFNDGNYDAALAEYVDFQKKYPQHPLVDGAEMGRIYCLEATGKIEEAIKAFSSLAKDKPKHFLVPQAIFGEARCLQLAGRPQEARIVYEDFIATHPESPWIPKAEEALSTLKKKMALSSDTKTVGSASSEINSMEAPAATAAAESVPAK